MREIDWQVWDGQGRRKYPTAAEVRLFLDAVSALEPRKAALCLLIAFTGCRVSEALLVTRDQVGHGTITLFTLKRRRRVFRHLQVPVWLSDLLLRLPVESDGRIWAEHRATAWRWVKRGMQLAALEGVYACPKGLRHGFGMRAALERVPANLIQKWLGHASPETTRIYLDAAGDEERVIASRVWPKS